MKKILIITTALILLVAVFTGCTNSISTNPQNPRTLPAPAQGAPSTPPQGITVNFIDFEKVDAKNLPSKQLDMIENLKTQKGYIFWQENEYFYIAILAGEQPTGGYIMDVKSIEDNEGKTNILVELIPPKDMATQAITYPFTVIKATGITDNFNIKDTNGNIYNEIK